MVNTSTSHPAQPTPPIVLVFAASDPSGGAGIQADIMTLTSMGCHPLTVITAITVQDTVGVESVLAMDADWVEDQARALLEDMPVAAFKVGMIGSVENVAAIAEIVSDYPNIPLILDPVLASGRGDDLATDDLISALIEMLLPQTTILTPNSLEARRLARYHEEDALDDLRHEDDGEEDGDNDSEPAEQGDQPALGECARRLLGRGCEYVLITGTHEPGTQVVNSLYGEGGIVRADAWERLPGSYHGSGCTLASAIAANLANGLELHDAVRDAQDFTWQALEAGFRPGMGQFIPDRFFWARDAADATGDNAASDEQSPSADA
jgi:hydroxymethylpyrimidine/phosphomethylpyrimidine kinase